MPQAKSAEPKEKKPRKPKEKAPPSLLPIGWAIQQEKREKVFRRALIVDPDELILEFDAAGQEFRWMAIHCGDETMLHLCQPGEDTHAFMGAAIAHREYRDVQKLAAADDPEAKHQRNLGKLANLSLQYRTSAKKLRVKARVDYGLPMEMPEAYNIYNTYHRQYPQVRAYWNAQIDKCMKRGYAETLGGSRVSLVGDWSSDMGWSLGSTAINYPIQGTGGDQKYLAISVLRNYMIPLGARMLLDLHDGLYWAVPKSKALKALHDCKYLLDNLPYKKAWGFDPPIPLPWDGKIGPSWALLKEPK